jgi:hypothetical protein
MSCEPWVSSTNLVLVETSWLLSSLLSLLLDICGFATELGLCFEKLKQGDDVGGSRICRCPGVLRG